MGHTQTQPREKIPFMQDFRTGGTPYILIGPAKSNG